MTHYFYTITIDDICRDDCDQNYDNCQCEPEVKLKEVDLDNPDLMQFLKQNGWIKEEEALKIFEEKAGKNSKIELEKEFYIVDKRFTYPSFGLANWSNYEASILAEGKHQLLQKVSIKSLKEAQPEFYKIYLAAKKQVDIQAKKKSEQTKKAAERKKKRELERAKKLLQEAGELK